MTTEDPILEISPAQAEADIHQADHQAVDALLRVADQDLQQVVADTAQEEALQATVRAIDLAEDHQAADAHLGIVQEDAPITDLAVIALIGDPTIDLVVMAQITGRIADLVAVTQGNDRF